VTDVDISIRIEAPPATVFRYFIDPNRMIEWIGVSADLEPHPGGVFRLNVTGIDTAVGEYVEIVAPERVVFTWGWEGSDTIPSGSTTVEVKLTADGDGTVVRLRHTGLPTDAEPEHLEGWTHYGARLAIAGAGGDPGPDPQRKTTT